MLLYCHFVNSVGPDQIVDNNSTYVLRALNNLHFSIIDADWGVYSTLPPEVGDQLLPFADIAGQIVALTLC